MLVSTAYAHTIEYAKVPVSGVSDYADRVFPPFDSSFFGSHVFWFINCFGLLYFFIARVVLPRIGNVIEMRRNKITSDLDQALVLKNEVDSIIILREKKLIEAREHANLITSRARDEARTKVASKHAEISSMHEDKLVEAEKRIACLCGKAMQDVEKIAEEMATELVEKLIGRKIGEAIVVKAVATARDSGVTNE